MPLSYCLFDVPIANHYAQRRSYLSSYLITGTHPLTGFVLPSDLNLLLFEKFIPGPIFPSHSFLVEKNFLSRSAAPL